MRAIDILIGTIAVNKTLCLVTDDSDFNYLQAVEPRLKIISTENYVKRIKEIKE